MEERSYIIPGGDTSNSPHKTSPQTETPSNPYSSSEKQPSAPLEERRYLIRQPKALQYFHKGVLYKADEKERVAGRFELFFDLLYVALIANLADDLYERPTGPNFVKFILTYTPAWHAWADAKENANNYFNDDLVQRLGIFWVMALLVLYGNNAPLVADDIAAMRVTVGTYMVLRFSQAACFAYYTLASPFHRFQNRLYAGLTVLGLVFGVPLMLEDVEIRVKVGVVVGWIIWEEASYIGSFAPWLANYLNLPFRTAADIAHEVDRYTAFTIIILGEFTYGILVGSPAAATTLSSPTTSTSSTLTPAVSRAIATLATAFCFNSIYDYEDGSMVRIHPLRRSVWSATTWMMLHLPLSAGLLVGGHASAASVAEEEMSSPRRWLYGGGLGAGMLGMWVLAMLFKDGDKAPRTPLLSKKFRIAPRLIAALIFVLLPLVAPERLSSTSLLSIGAGITSFVVLWETVAGLDACAGLFEPWDKELRLHAHVVDVSVP